MFFTDYRLPITVHRLLHTGQSTYTFLQQIAQYQAVDDCLYRSAFVGKNDLAWVEGDLVVYGRFQSRPQQRVHRFIQLGQILLQILRRGWLYRGD